MIIFLKNISNQTRGKLVAWGDRIERVGWRLKKVSKQSSSAFSLLSHDAGIDL